MTDTSTRTLPTAEELRALQKPLKQTYRGHPEKALVRSSASVHLADDGIAMRMTLRAGTVRAIDTWDARGTHGIDKDAGRSHRCAARGRARAGVTSCRR